MGGIYIFCYLILFPLLLPLPTFFHPCSKKKWKRKKNERSLKDIITRYYRCCCRLGFNCLIVANDCVALPRSTSLHILHALLYLLCVNVNTRYRGAVTFYPYGEKDIMWICQLCHPKNVFAGSFSLMVLSHTHILPYGSYCLWRNAYYLLISRSLPLLESSSSLRPVLRIYIVFSSNMCDRRLGIGAAVYFS